MKKEKAMKSTLMKDMDTLHTSRISDSACRIMELMPSDDDKAEMSVSLGVATVAAGVQMVIESAFARCGDSVDEAQLRRSIIELTERVYDNRVGAVCAAVKDAIWRGRDEQ